MMSWVVRDPTRLPVIAHMPLVEKAGLLRWWQQIFFFSPVALCNSFGVILLITKYIRGFWFHILEQVSLNYTSRGTHPAGSPHPPTVDCRGCGREENSGCCMLGTVEANEILLQAFRAAPAVL